MFFMPQKPGYLILLPIFILLTCRFAYAEKIIIISGSSGFAPLSYLDDRGRPSGYLVDYWNLWAKRTGYKVKFRLQTWEKGMNLVKEGKADFHSGMFRSEGREPFFDFANPLGKISTTLYCSTLLNIDSIDEIKNLPVGVLKGDYSVEFMRKEYPEIKLKIFLSTKDMFRSVSNSEILLFIFDQPQVVYYLHHENLVGRFRSIKNMYTQNLYPAVKKGNSKILKIITSGMSNISYSERELYFDTWVFYDRQSIDTVIIALAFSLVLVLTVFLIVHYFSIKRHVKMKTTVLRKELCRKETVQSRLMQMAMHDPLTELPNRKLFFERLEHAIACAKRYYEMIAVLFLDLDGFKEINDTYGHGAGDEILKVSASRLTGVIREFDTASRLGGDEFIIILEKINSRKEIEIVARRILEILSQPFFSQENELSVTVSIGICVYPTDNTEPEKLVKYADDAMYRSKTAGKNRYSFYSDPE